MAKDDLIPRAKATPAPGPRESKIVHVRRPGQGRRNYMDAMGLSWVGQASQRYKFLGGGLAALAGADAYADPDYNPFEDEGVDGAWMIENGLAGELEAAGNAQQARLAVDMAKANMSRRRRLEEGGASWAYLGAGLTDPSNLIPVPWKAAAGKGAWAAIKASTPANTAIIAGTEGFRHDLDPTSTAEETWSAIGMGSGFAGAFAGVLGGIGRRVGRIAERTHNESFHGGDMQPKPANTVYMVGRPDVEGGGVLFTKNQGRVIDDADTAMAEYEAAVAKGGKGTDEPLLLEIDREMLDADGNVSPGGWRAVRRVHMADPDAERLAGEIAEDVAPGWEVAARSEVLEQSVERLDWRIEEIEKDLPDITMRVMDLGDMRDELRRVEADAEKIMDARRAELANAERLPPEEAVRTEEARAAYDEAQGAFRDAYFKRQQVDDEIKELQDEVAYVGRTAATYRSRRARLLERDPDDPIDWSIVPTGVKMEDFLARSGQFPWYRLIQNGMRRIDPRLASKMQGFAVRLANNPGLLLKGHQLGHTLGPAVEARARTWMGSFVGAKKEIDDVFAEYAGMKSFGAVKSATLKLADSGKGQRMSYEEFQNAVGRAVIQGTSDPHLQRAASIVEERVFGPMFDDMEELGLLPTKRNLTRKQGKVRAAMDARLQKLEKMKDGTSRQALRISDEIIEDMRALDEIESRLVEYSEGADYWRKKFFHRMWDRQAILDNMDEFRGILRKHFENDSTFREVGPDGKLVTRASYMEPNKIDARVDEAIHTIMNEADFGDTASMLNTRTMRQVLEDRLARYEHESFQAAMKGEDDLAKKLSQQETIIKRKLENLKDDVDERKWGAPSMFHGRKLDIDNADVIGFINTNWEEVSAHYLDRAGRRIEIAREFGDVNAETERALIRAEFNKKIDEALPGWEEADLIRQRDEFWQDSEDLVLKVMGVYEMPVNPAALSTRAIRAVMGLGVMTTMGRSLYTQVADAGQAVLADYSKGLLKNWLGYVRGTGDGPHSWRMAKKEAREMGLAVEVTLASLGVATRSSTFAEMGGRKFGVTAAERGLNRGVTASFILNLMAPWTDMMKTFSGTLTASRILREAQQWVDGTLPAEQMQELAAWGMDKEFAKAVVEQHRQFGGQVDGLMVAGTPAWSDKAAAMRFRGMLAGAMENLVMTPGAASRPNLLKGDVARMILQYKAFGMVATQVIFMGGLQRRNARYMNAVAAMIGLAYITDYARDDNFKNLSLGEQAVRSVERSGVLGTLSDLNGMLEDVSNDEWGVTGSFIGDNLGVKTKDRNWARRMGPLVGSAPSKWLNAMWAFTSEDARGYDQVKALRYLVPLNNLLYLNRGVDEIQKGAIGAWEGQFGPSGVKLGGGVDIFATGGDGKPKKMRMGETYVGKVVKVSDGDTVTMRLQDGSRMKIRLGGVDAPESGQPYGRASQRKLDSLVGGKMVRMQIKDGDMYGRAVATISTLDGLDVNQEMVKAGAAWNYRGGFSSGKRQEAAEEAGVGLWEK